MCTHCHVYAYMQYVVQANVQTSAPSMHQCLSDAGPTVSAPLLPSEVNLCCRVARVYFHAIFYFRLHTVHSPLLTKIFLQVFLQFFLNKFFTFLCHFPLLVDFLGFYHSKWSIWNGCCHDKVMELQLASIVLEPALHIYLNAWDSMCVYVRLRALTLDLFIYNFSWVYLLLSLAVCNKCLDSQHVAEKYISKMCAFNTGWGKLDPLDFLIIHKVIHSYICISIFTIRTMYECI